MIAVKGRKGDRATGKIFGMLVFVGLGLGEKEGWREFACCTWVISGRDCWEVGR